MSGARTLDEAGLVDIRTRVPDIAEDIRYAGSDNFVGAPVDGYRAPRCYLLPEAADALASVERRLRTQAMRLLVFDCYRPARAVRHFVRWAQDLSDERTKAASLSDAGQATTARRLHRTGFRAQPWRDGRPDAAGLFGRPRLRTGGHGNGFRLLRSAGEHRIAIGDGRAATEPAAAEDGDGSGRIQQLFAGVVALHAGVGTCAGAPVRRPDRIATGESSHAQAFGVLLLTAARGWMRHTGTGHARYRRSDGALFGQRPGRIAARDPRWRAGRAARLRHGGPGGATRSDARDQLPAGIGDQAVHGRGDPVAGRGWNARTRRSRAHVAAGAACRDRHDHHPAPAHAYVRTDRLRRRDCRRHDAPVARRRCAAVAVDAEPHVVSRRGRPTATATVATRCWR